MSNADSEKKREQEEELRVGEMLRPRILSEYVGQRAIKENLSIALEASGKRKDALEHILLHGPAGLGKTTLAHIIATERKTDIRVTSGPALERVGDVASILTNLEEGDILFIDEIHRLHRTVEEVLYPAMEEFALDLVIGKGPSARTVRLDLPRFTLVGATTRVSLLSGPLRDRFGLTFRLNYYDTQDIEEILARSSRILGVELEREALTLLAERARATPRVANRLLRRVRDFVQVKGGSTVTTQHAEQALAMLQIDAFGLDEVDRRILETIMEKFKGGPVGLSTMAASVREDEDTLADMYEPFLMQIGFLARTPRGRVVTERAYDHLKKSQPGLLSRAR